MPKKEHAKVARAARKAGLKPGSDSYNAYVYSTLRKIDQRRKAKRNK
jgi:hypothetical protein